jgi:hypothetical protein
MTIRTALTALATLLALSACGGTPTTTADPDKVQASTAPADSKSEPEADVKAYFEAVWSEDVAERKSAIDMAAPGSHAAAYATYLAASAQATADAGGGSAKVDPTFRATDEGFEECSTVDGEKYCTTATDIEVLDGKVASFSTDGSPIGERLVLGNGKAKQLGSMGSATLLAAYRTGKGVLWTIFEIKSNVAGLGINYDTFYVAPNGRQTQQGGSTAPASLGKGALANAAVGFDGAEFGGTVHLNVYTAEPPYGTGGAEFKIK